MGQAHVQGRKGGQRLQKMAFPHGLALIVGRKDLICLFRFVDHLTGQLGYWLRDQSGISGGKPGQSEPEYDHIPP